MIHTDQETESSRRIATRRWCNATHCELCGKEDKYLDRGMCMDCIKLEYADSDNI